MKATLDPNDRQFLSRLRRMEDGTVHEICAEIGVTATAIRQRLTRLQGLGFVTREAVRCGRGRPHHVYRVSTAGLRELGDNYGDLATILWQEVNNIEHPEVRAQVMGRVRQAMVAQFAPVVRADSLSERFDDLKTALLARGFDVEVDNSGPLPILRENNCPYLELAGSDPSICEMEQEIFHRVLGVEIKLTQCCLDGAHCCEFQPSVELS